MQSLNQIEETENEKKILSHLPAVTEDFAVMDVLDTDLIQRDLDGVLQDELVYSFEVSGRPVVGLTAFGATALARTAVQQFDYSIRCDKPVIEERKDVFKASCKVAFQTPRGNVLELWGEKVQPRKIKMKDGTEKENENAEIIAGTKAQRNGLLKIFPPKQTASFILACINEGKVRNVSKDEVNQALEKSKRVGSGSAKPASEPKTKESPQQKLLALPGYESKTKLVEIADDHIEDMRKALTSISWYYSSSGDYRNNIAFKAGNPWGWARKESQDAEGIVASLDEEGPDSKIIFDNEEFWYDEDAGKLWRRRVTA